MPDGAGLKVLIVAAKFNDDLVAPLAGSVEAALRAQGCEVSIRRVPGSWELPYAAQVLASARDIDAVVAIGIVIAGDTRHHEHIADATGYGIQEAALRTGVPVINGIIVTETREQAEARSTGDIDKGLHFARAAIEMARFRHEMRERGVIE